MRGSILLGAELLSLIGCSSPPGLGVSLGNESGEAIYQVRLQAGGSMFGIDQLPAGEKASGSLDVVTDSAAEVVYRRSPQSEEIHCGGDVYVAAGARQTLVVVVGKDECAFRIQ
ncbi:hypothetical protein [Stenotrophomonas maltophilia]|uniref:hypothetical protein n=1 Tax=Stenotrophomonas maltophilia TaxID=40324 RepID=UPI000C1518FA|nr:hypothetical protein [Stenotrophomonas maltophilia]